MPVRGSAEPLGIGFWIRISGDAYDDFERHGRVDHPAYDGHIANQSTFLGPTLGLRARMTFRRRGLRPALQLLDASDALARAQADEPRRRRLVAQARSDRWARRVERHAGELTARPRAHRARRSLLDRPRARPGARARRGVSGPDATATLA